MGRRKRHSGGGGGGGGNQWMGFIAIIFGAVAMLICLIMFGVGIGALDDAYTEAAGYVDQVGLTDVMGIFGLVVFIAFMSAGIASLVGGAYIQWKKATTGGWMDVFMVAVMGGVTLVICLLLNTTIQSQLNTAIVTVNATVNIAEFSGLYDVMTVWGMVIFLALIGAGLSQLAAAGYGSYKHLSGKM